MTHKDNMNRTEENNIMMERIYKELNEYPTEKINDIVDAKLLILMDVSRSLAIIADKLDREE